jgi:hypothetical protein
MSSLDIDDNHLKGMWIFNISAALPLTNSKISAHLLLSHKNP